ncbi:MAG: hypothetical protein ACE37F_36290 [Nannocystaceae bacterium]|nr:hypothetical protein [bacterium]
MFVLHDRGHKHGLHLAHIRGPHEGRRERHVHAAEALDDVGDHPRFALSARRGCEQGRNPSLDGFGARAARWRVPLEVEAGRRHVVGWRGDTDETAGQHE